MGKVAVATDRDFRSKVLKAPFVLAEFWGEG